MDSYQSLTCLIQNENFVIENQRIKKCSVWIDRDKKLPWNIEIKEIIKHRKRSPEFNIFLFRYSFNVDELKYFIDWNKKIDLKVLFAIEKCKSGGLKYQNSHLYLFKLKRKLFFSSSELEYYFKANLLYKSIRVSKKVDDINIS